MARLPRYLTLCFAALSAVACNNTKLTASVAQISFEPQSIDFGNQVPGTTSKAKLKISNEGNRALSFSAAKILGDTRMAFTVDKLPDTLGAGQSVTLNVSYFSASEGADGATLVIDSNADNTPESRVPLVGRTQSNCDKGKTDCSGKCVDGQTDAANCGTCGRACTSKEACIAGSCKCVPTTCMAAGAACGTIPDGCGGMLTCPTCGATTVCITNLCVPPTCMDKMQDGNETAIDCGGPDCPGCAAGSACKVGTDCALPSGCVSGTCGSCGDSSQCKTGFVCLSGVCTGCMNDLQCPGGNTCVAGVCKSCNGSTKPVDTQNDAANCGTCGNACPTPLNAAALCGKGVCGRGPCNSGFFDLDPTILGCESSCVNKVCTDSNGKTTTLTADPIPERSSVFAALASGSSYGAAVQTSSKYTNIGVLGEPTPPGVGGATQQTGGGFTNIGGLNAVQHKP